MYFLEISKFWLTFHFSYGKGQQLTPQETVRKRVFRKFFKKIICSFRCYFQGLFFVLIRIFIKDFSFFLNEKLRKMLFLKKIFSLTRETAGVCARCTRRLCILINFEKIHQKIFRALRAQRALHYSIDKKNFFHKKRDICLSWKKSIYFKFHFCFVKKIQPEIEANFTDHHPIHQILRDAWSVKHGNYGAFLAF